MSTEIELGKDILSYCGKCKMPTNHVINTLTKKGKPDKCECQTCKALHKYRDPDKPVKPRATKRTTKKAGLSIEAMWNAAIADAKGPGKTYAMNAEFGEGDLIEHATFGKGVVEEIVGHNAIKVIFETAEKVLAHKR